MRVAYAVSGYVADDQVSARGGEWAPSGDTVELLLEPGRRERVIRVPVKDVAEIRSAPQAGGHLMVQLVLREDANVETAVAGGVGDDSWSRLSDPLLGVSATASVITKIMI